MENGWLVLKDNYVIDVVVWDGITPFSYPFPHDAMLPTSGNLAFAGMGDWYEASENILYRPLGVTPSDSPLYNFHP